MRRHVVRSILFGVAILSLTAPSAQAAQYRTRVGLPLPMIWDLASNWVIYDQVMDVWLPGIPLLNQFPQAGDTVEVLPGHWVVLDSDETVGTLTVHAGALLEMGPYHLTIAGAGIPGANMGGLRCEGDLWVQGGELRLTGGGVQRVSGTIYLKTYSSILRIQNNLKLIDGGKIVGQHDLASILIDNGRTFTSEITIEGSLTISRSGGSGAGFVNDGLVQANRVTVPFLVTIQNVVLQGSGTFKVGEGSASDEINLSSSVVCAKDLNASFVILDGALDIDTDVITTGRLSFIDGQIEVAAGKVFIIP